MSNTTKLSYEEAKRKRIEETRRRRQERGPLDPMLAALKLSVPPERKDRDFEYRWVNDTAMRVHAMQAMDWELVDDESIAADERNSGIGTRIERVVNERTTPTPQKGFLMRKYREFYDEDQARKHAAIDEGEKTILQGQIPNADADKTLSNRYVPEGGIRIRHGGKRRSP